VRPLPAGDECFARLIEQQPHQIDDAFHITLRYHPSERLAPQ